MNSRQRATDRALRIEMLRARAALERQAIRRSVTDLGNDLSPSGLAGSLLPDFNSRSVVSGIGKLFALTRRYPLITSAASTLLSGFGRKGRWWRVAAAVAASWYVGQHVSRRR